MIRTGKKKMRQWQEKKLLSMEKKCDGREGKKTLKQGKGKVMKEERGKKER